MASTQPRINGVAVIAAPVLLLISTIVGISGSGFGDDAASGVVQVYAAIAFVVTLYAIVTLARDHGVGTGALSALTVVGAFGVTGMGLYALNGIYTDLGTFDLNEESTATATLGLQIPGVLFPLAFVLAAVVLVRSGVISKIHGATLGLAAVLFPASRIAEIDALAVACDVIFVVALIPLGWRLLSAGR